ncbi:uncharacterized protein BO95DRAFT_221466 [Aspergillus brunneoviolaceus CBS 621.78]|uniref:Uncharacterized protein n=1 Tax=Aspergillus brunneoviolaceus CBS 621.78 TaxID=1450534 RepID=A0ACD1GLZ6_9EURO|nr:hypothetical protein BO95DRAFT_221466 [Aspergillus brunneoviolaceus CBS 621.78]RAH50101.1 hypothetical protein BO95DRAFT_221466 [Aspergillus brunneoviolaceus CBS 621.78]
MAAGCTLPGASLVESWSTLLPDSSGIVDLGISMPRRSLVRHSGDWKWKMLRCNLVVSAVRRNDRRDMYRTYWAG